MTNRRSRFLKSRSQSLRFQQRDQARRETLRSLRVETLEERQLLAANLELVGLQPDGDEFIQEGDVRDVSPTTLRFIFSGNQSIDASTLDAIQVTRAGGDGGFGDANDVMITPGFVGLGDVSNEVLLRFAETLPDDEYRIDIIGTGDDALRNTDGEAFNGGEDQQIHFRLDLGAQVVAVVPQPIEDQGGTLVQQRDQIVVYFNDDDLYVPDAENADLYQLVFTGDTANNQDDVVFVPDTVNYDAAADQAVLTFASDLHELIDPDTGDPIGAGSFRLRIGTNESIPMPPLVIVPSTDVGSSFGAAFDIGTLEGQSRLVSTDIEAQPFSLDYPGANDEPGHREIPGEVAGDFDNHLNPLFGPDSTDGATTILYNFQANYGVDNLGQPLSNLITDTQKQRAREAFEVWGEYIGVQFLETADQGLTIVTGDPHALDPDGEDVVNHALEKPIVDAGFMVRIDPGYQDSLLILDNAKQWNDDFGADWYKTTMTGIGFMLGLERASDLPSSTLMAYASDFTYPGATTPEAIYPGNHDILHGRYLHRPDSNDIDMYRFEIAVGEEGVFTAETFAERQPNSSLLDSVLVLYRENEDGSREVIARNDDYYSEDAFVELRLDAGIYYLGVSASGNDQYNPEFENTGFGGRSQGAYDLRMDFRADPEPGDAMRDAGEGNTPGTLLDGNADGVPGGVYNFWFRAVAPGNTILVDKLGRPAETGTKGSFQAINSALAVAQPGDVVRIVGNGGSDGDFSTLTDNFAYEIGPGPLQNQILADGKTLDVPKGVTVMVDAGAIFKMNQSRIGVGSSSLSVDRSGGALQVLGTPELPVYFTSYDDESIGVDTYQPTTTPRPGNWGGIVFRNDFDNAEERTNYEDVGVFLNYINHADIRYGGGNVDVNSLRQIVTPVQMVEARPTITSNVITLSADAPLSADPDSFEETNFLAPKFQLKGLFTSDYQRVGPQIQGNLLVENSSNGLFIRITTPAGDEQRGLTVAGRFDDTDVVHIISENLRIQGKSGEPILELVRPPVNVVTVTPQAGGELEPDTYYYKLIFVDTNGFEGRPSEATNAVTLAGANNAVVLDNLPAAGGDFTARRIYRSTDGVAGPYVFVDQINASDATYLDTTALADLNASNTLQRDVPTVLGVTLSESADASTLVPGVYNYRITYLNSVDGAESPSSDPTVALTIPVTTSIELQNLVAPNTNGYDRIRIYRSQADGAAPYQLAGEIAATETTFVDSGASSDETLDPVTFGVARARTDARLAIDPGTIVKLEGSRIETTFGAQLIAEGRDGREIIFTSRSDDRYGAGGTFDTNGDGDTAAPAPGSWGGLYVGALGTASIDYARLMFGGGVTKIEGTFKAFNVLEIHQADVRLAHSVIEQNADGQAGQGPAERFGRGTNEPATIFVRGAQPILVGNTIQNNDEVAISINANSFTPDPLPDMGRSTGEIALAGQYPDNTGPLIRDNRMFNNPLNAVDIRGEVLTTASIWDDTDIVHVLRDEQIIVPDVHSNVGLRLQSSPSASLVVKMEGPGDNFDSSLGAGFTATGRQLDIADRIGGTIQVIGQPDFPVILTSLSDDTVGAGFTPDGQTLTDTNNNGWATLPAPGDWRSVRIDQFANDRNVDLVLETETLNTAAPGENATPDSAQYLGDLAAFEQGGDDNLRLGFEVHGVLNERNDIDVYSFEAAAGTEVWLDIDRTTNTLNSVIELIDSDGTVIARSDNSFDETQDPSLLFRSPAIQDSHVNPLQKVAAEFQPKNASGQPRDNFALNRLDPGMRVVLPGVVGSRSAYHVRVRSSSNDLGYLAGGLTTGSYQLQVRLRETDEVPGVTVRYADVRYATNGIELYGLPGHSPLLGEVAEDEEVGGPEHNGQVPIGAAAGTGPQDIGNLLETERAVLSIAGTINSLDDIDFYEMQIAYEATAGTSNQHAPVMFDVDYASGLSRPDTIVSVFDSFGRLLLIGRDSNIADDRGGALDEGNLSDLSRGSLGALDPFIGPVEMPEATYFVAVTSNARVPSQLLSNPDLRLEPVNTVTRVAEDHIGQSGGSTAGAPQVPLLLDDSSIVPALPSDITVLILHDEGNDDEVLLSAAGLTDGVVSRTIGPYPGKVQDLATREDGNAYAFTTPDDDPVPDDATTGLLRGVNISAPQYVGARDDGIETYNEDPLTAGVAIPSNVGIRFHAVTYGDIDGEERLFAVGSRGDADTTPAGPDFFTNLLYQFDSRTGQAISDPQPDRVGNARMEGAGTQVVERGYLDTNSGGGPGGLITGLSIYDGKLYALAESGGLFLVENPLTDSASLTYIADVVTNAGVVQEVETNNSMAEAQDLDREVWTQRYDDNIGDTTSNTSTSIKHITIEGTGDDGYDGFFITSGAGGLDRPTGSAFDPTDGNFYVASAETDEILRYDGVTGAFIDIFVSAASGGLDEPEGIAFGPDSTGDDIPELFVASRATDQVLRYNGATGAFIDIFADTGFAGPTGLAFGADPTGDDIPELYIGGFDSDNVVEVNGETGAYLRDLVPAGRAGLDGPVGLSYETGEKLYVASANDNSLLYFDAITGAFVDEVVVSGLGGLDQPQYFVIGPDANGDGDEELYITSFGNDSVMRYNANTGAFVDDFVFSGNGGMDGPTGVHFLADGTLIVSSSLTDAVMRFNTAGTPTFDFYSFTIENDNDRGIFDIDFGMINGDPGSFNSEIFILDDAGAIVATNDDASIRLGAAGSVETEDAYLEWVFASAGQYFLMVGEFDSDVTGGVGTGDRADLTDTYTLNISIENYVGSSFEGMAANMLPSVESDGIFLAIDRQGDLFAFSTDDNAVTAEPFFDGARSRIPTGVQDVMGIALTTTNLWHITDARYDDKGHGLTNVFDDSRGNASVIAEREPNDTPATAQDLELEFWNLGYNSNIGDASDPPINTSTTIPHVTINGGGDGTRDYYSFEVATAGSLGIFDIDMDFDEQQDPGWFMDAEIRLLDEYGNLITWVEDAVLPTDGDGGKDRIYDPPREPYLEYVFPAAGTYVLEVTKFVPPFIWQPPEDGDFYTLQVSLENHRVDGPASEGGQSFFFGTELTGVITNVIAGDPVEITSPGHGLVDGDRVDIQGIEGVPGANGTWIVTGADEDAGTFELEDSDVLGTYLGGGTWRLLYTPEDMAGTILSRPFSLLGYSPDDLPVLYFNYLLDAADAADTDLVSVSIVEGDGTQTPLVVKGAGLTTAGPTVPGEPVQWRQARVDLSDFADKADLRLLFSFDKAGAAATGFEGFLIDDIIIGFAERGEMVSFAYNDPSFTVNPDSETTDALTGPYQLEIRPGTDPGPSQRPTVDHPNSQQLEKSFDTNERLAQQTTLVPPAGADITEGQTFTISDGLSTLTFEYDEDGTVVEGNVRVVFDASYGANEVGQSIRDAVNGPAVQATLDLSASVSAGTLRTTIFADGTIPTDPLYQLVDLAGNAIVTGIQHIMYDEFGDVNRFRDQGQVLIHSNFVTDSRDFGIIVDAGVRDVEPRLQTALLEPHAGAVRNLRELNNEVPGGVAPGAVVENNVITNEGLGGIHASGNLAPFEIIAPTDTLTTLSGEFICDGETFTVHSNRTTVTFEFEDISGGSAPCGSTIQGGDGWREGNIPVFYRQSGSNYLSPPWYIPPRPYVQEEMATAIRDAIQSSILVTNGTTLHANTTLESSRWQRHALTGLPLVSVYLDNVSEIDVSGTRWLSGRQTPLGASAQPFHRVLNNTIYGNDGLQAFYPGSGLDEPNDRLATAVETWQGRQHNLEFFQDDAVIGDSVDTLNDVSLDVDFYRFQLEIGERVTIDIDAAPVSPLDSVLRLFDASGVEVAFNDNGTGPGETGGADAFIDFTASSAGTYYVAVSGKGNETYDPLSLGSRTGPASVGDYSIEIDVLAPRTWVITAQDGTLVPDGTTFTVSDINGSVTYEFDDVNAPGITPGNVAIVYDSRPVRPAGFNHRGPGYRAPEMAVAMASTIGQGLTGVSAVALGGNAGASGPLPPQVPAIQGDTSVFGFPGFGHDSPFTPPQASGELYVVVTGASSITGNVLFQPLIDENIDQLLPETGILVSEAASPTLLNNVLSNLNAGIWQDASPSTVVGASVYQHNDQADSNVGSTDDDFNIHLGDYDRLFVNAADGNFYPARFSPIIDSAIDSLEERVRLATVKGAVGIPVSPILAPNLDAVGLLRSDDPEVDTPLGQGANVFKDRGGLDRADFVGPDAVLVVPRDNDTAGLDLDPAPTIVQLAAGSYDNFSVQLVDGLQASDSGEGVGVNDLTVNSSNITLTADGQLLKEDIDYTFRYNAITNTMRFTPLAGVWDNGKVYVITLPNQDRFVVEIPDGSQVVDGETFVITDEGGGTVTFEFESGYSLFVPETLTLTIPEAGKGAGGIEDGQRFTVSAGFFGQYTFEYDNNSPPSFLPGNIPIDISTISTQDELALATIDALIAENVGVTPSYLGAGRIHFGAPSSYSVDTSLTEMTQAGQPGVVADGDVILVSDGVNPTVRFEFDSNGNVAAGNVAIPFSLASTQDDISNSITATIAAAGVGLTPTYFGAGHVHLGGTPDHRVVISGTPNLTQTGNPGVRSSTTLTVPPQAAGVGGVADGQWFSIQNGADTPVRFEFDDDGVVTPGSRAILFTNTSTVDQLANYIISAIELANVDLTPQYLGGGFIALEDTIHHRTDTLNTAVDQFGVPGGVVTIEFLPDATFDAEQFAPLILDAIANSELTDVTTTFRGGSTYFVNGVKSISGLQNFFISAIEDNAGNNLQPNQASNQTRFTIVMPDVESDFGDAPDSFGTLFNSIGARHVISDNPLLLGLGVTTEDDGKPSVGADADEDDGVDLSMSVFNEHLETPVTVYATGRGLLDAWIDFNMDGDWNDPGEQVFTSEQLSAGNNELLISTPAFAGIGDTYARFRISTLGGLGPASLAIDGEVEDYLIRIEPGQPPVAVDDTGFSVDEDMTLVIDPADLLANDTDPDTPHDQLVVRRFETVSQLGAAVSWDGNGKIVYDPSASATLQALKPGEQLTDTFAYQASDGVLPSNWADVEIVVNGVNNAPVAVPNDYATDEDTELQIGAPGVLENDYDVDGDTLIVSDFDAISAMGAIVVVNADGSFSYDPTEAPDIQALAQDETATDTFSYTIEDDLGATSSTTVSIALTGLNDAPTAVDDDYDTDEDTVLNVAAPGVLVNDSDIDGDAFGVTAADVTSQYGAIVSVNADGTLSYDPTGSDTLQDLAVGESLDDTFSYTIADVHGATASATVTVTVEGRNDDPVAVDDDYATFEDDVLTVTPAGVLANDTDRDGDPLAVDVANTDAVTALGVPITVNADGSFTYDPTGTDLGVAPGDTTDDTFTYTVTDPHGGTDTAIVTIEVTGVNNAPIATDKTFDTDEDTALDIAAPGVMAGDSDPDGQAIAIDSYDAISVWGAAVVVNADGSFTYDPTVSDSLQALNDGTTVTDSFTYTIVDDDLNPKSDTATIFVDVDGVNDPPVAVDDSAAVPRNGSSVIDVLDNDFDIDGTLDTSTVAIVTDPANGTATVLADGTIQYVPTADFSGIDTLTYTVRDNSGAVSNEAVVSVLVNAAPVAVDDDAETFINVPTTIDVLANDSDIDGVLAPATLTIVDQPDNGSVSITAAHKVVYTPDTGFSGNDSFTYTVDDNHGATSNEANVSIAVIIDPFPWQNPVEPLDVNADTFISPIDALLIISDLNENGGRELPNPPVPPFIPPPYLDPSGDNFVSPIDALLVISYLNGEGEGEAEGEGEGGAYLAASSPSTGDADSAGVALLASTLSSNNSNGIAQADGATSDLAVTIEADAAQQGGQDSDFHSAALASYLASGAQEEDLEELLEGGHSLQDEDVLEDQALLELLAGKDGNH